MEPMVLDKREITKGKCVLEDLLCETKFKVKLVLTNGNSNTRECND